MRDEGLGMRELRTYNCKIGQGICIFNAMKRAEQRELLAKRILETKDKNVLNYIQAIFDNGGRELDDTIPEYVEKSIERGLKDIKEGRTIPHAEVMKKYKKWLKK